MTLGGGGSNSNERYVKQQHAYDIQKWMLDWQDMQDAYTFQKDTFDLRKANQLDQIKYQEQAALQEWTDKEKLRIFDYNNQIEAYNASKDAYEERLEFNELAQQMALDEKTRQYNETLTSIGFQNEDLLMKLQFAQESTALQRAETDLNFDAATDEVSLSIQSAKKEEALTGKKLAEQARTRKMDISQKAEDAKLKSLNQLGIVSNLGQAGRTAHKNIQSVLATHARANHALTELLVREDNQYGLSLEAVANKLDAVKATGVTKLKQARGRGALAYDKIASDFLQKVETTAFSHKQLQESMKSAGLQYERDAKQTAIDRYNSDIQALSNLAEEPVLAPRMTPPLKLPRPQFQEPAAPITWERYKTLRPIEGAVSKGPSGLSRMLGFAASVAGIFRSDDRVKYDINRVGTSPSGIPKYTFKYRFDGEHGPTYIGTSAQDLLSMGRKDAVVQTEKDGFYSVDYSKLDVEFETVTLT